MDKLKNNLSAILWVSIFFLALGMLFARVVYPEHLWLTIAVGVLLIGALAALIQQNRMALKSRTTAFGLNSVVTSILVLAIIIVLNFMASRYPAKLDLTKNKIHTLSDQTAKVLKGLKKPVKAVMFSKPSQRDEFRQLLENLKGLNPKFEVEYVDPDKEPTRAKQVGIKKYGTLQLISGERESKVEEINEEKITNAMIKLLKEKSQVLCSVTGHGERVFSSQEAEGYSLAKKALSDQSYEIKEISLVQEAKIPTECDAVALLGPTKSLFEPEVKLLEKYLADGGRLLVAVDIDLDKGELAPEVSKLLASWHIKANSTLIVDPLSRMFGVDAAVPIIGLYSKDHAITKDLQATDSSYFPFARSLEVMADAPAGMNVLWLAQSTPKSWAESNLRELASGQVRFDASSADRPGPLNVAVAVEGKLKDSKAPQNTRLVVFGTSHFATNHYGRYGKNLDLFMNAASWIMEDDSLISIRGKDEGAGKVELSQKQGAVIFLVTVIVIPLLVAASGIGVWVYRRRL